MQTVETSVTFEDCASEVRRLYGIRLGACREAIASKGANKMTAQAAHVQLAKLRGALEIIEEIRIAEGIAARETRRARTVKTTI